MSELERITQGSLDIISIFGLDPKSYFTRLAVDKNGEAERFKKDLDASFRELKSKLNPENYEGLSKTSHDHAGELLERVKMAYGVLTEGQERHDFASQLDCYFSSINTTDTRKADTTIALEIFLGLCENFEEKKSVALQVRNDDLERQVSRLSREVTRLGEESLGYRDELEAERDRNGAAVEKFDELKGRFTTLGSGYDELAELLSDRGLDLMGAELRIEELGRMITGYEKQISSGAHDLNKLRSRHDTLQARFDNSEQNLRDATQRAKSLQKGGKKNLRDYTATRKQLEKERGKLTKDLGTVTQLHQTLESNYEILEGRLHVSGEQVKQAHAGLAAAEEVITQYNHELENLRKIYRDLEKTLDTRTAELESVIRDHSELTDKYQNLISERNLIKAAAQTTSDQLGTTSQDYAESQQRIKELEGAIERKEATITRIKGFYDRSQEELIRLERDLATTAGNFHGIERYVAALRDRFDVKVKAEEDKYETLIDYLSTPHQEGVTLAENIIKKVVEYRTQGQHREALAGCELALHLEPENHHAHYFAGTIHESLDQLDDALEHYQLAGNGSSAVAGVERVREALEP